MQNGKYKNYRELIYSFQKFNAPKAQAEPDTIYIYGPIFDVAFFEDEVTTQDVLNQLENMKDADEISVRINSPGGLAYEGIAIYNALVRAKPKINVFIDGLAASAASIVAMSGDTINMADNGTMMIHEPFGLVIGTMDDMMKEAEVLEKITDGMTNTYSKRTGQSKDSIRNFMKEETWFTADEAVNNGFADTVIESKSKPEAKADLSIYANVPKWVKEQYSMEEPPERKDKDKTGSEINLNSSRADADKIAEYLKTQIENGEFDYVFDERSGEKRKLKKDNNGDMPYKLNHLKRKLKIQELET